MVQLTVQIWLLSGPENFTALPNYFNFAEFTSGSPFETAYLSTDITMAPLPAISGGTVAEVSTYCAINRNTNQAEEAFFLIGLIMSREYQANSQLFSSVSACDGNMPLDRGLRGPGNPYHPTSLFLWNLPGSSTKNGSGSAAR